MIFPLHVCQELHTSLCEAKTFFHTFPNQKKTAHNCLQETLFLWPHGLLFPACNICTFSQIKGEKISSVTAHNESYQQIVMKTRMLGGIVAQKCCIFWKKPQFDQNLESAQNGLKHPEMLKKCKSRRDTKQKHFCCRLQIWKVHAGFNRGKKEPSQP